MAQFYAAQTDVHIVNARAAAPAYMNKLVDLTMRSHALMLLMDKYGTIERNAGDAARIYSVKVREHDVRSRTDTTRINFANTQNYEQCEVDVRSYEVTDSLTEEQYKKNQGNRLINLLDQKQKDMVKTLGRRMNEYLYHDGDSAAYQDGFRGFESCLADDGNTVVGDRVAIPSDSYAGLSTALGTFGSHWETAGSNPYNTALGKAWPEGVGRDGSYDANSPLLLNWSSTAWPSGSNEWADNLEYVLREAKAIQMVRCGEGMAPMLFLMTSSMFTAAENFYSQRHRVLAPYDGEQGFPQHNILIDGVILKPDYGCPSNTFYGVAPDNVEMFFFPPMNQGEGEFTVGGNSIIDMFGPTWDDAMGAFLMRADTYGNMKMYPKHMVKGFNYASA